MSSVLIRHMFNIKDLQKYHAYGIFKWSSNRIKIRYSYIPIEYGYDVSNSNLPPLTGTSQLKRQIRKI